LNVNRKTFNVWRSGNKTFQHGGSTIPWIHLHKSLQKISLKVNFFRNSNKILLVIQFLNV